MDHAEPGLSADQRGEGSEGAGFRLTFLPQAFAMRKGNPVMCYGSYRLLWPDDLEIFADIKELDREKWLIAANFSKTFCRRTLPPEAGTYQELLANTDKPSDFSENEIKL